ncbi:MAG: hypothetical protein COY66_02500 [Candidatus Kerfeldbacteria bacterium CG_4_10_14_0_8_um_filter_42_10]|uniref:Radical SAM core domain-containing protein n=1 Tax=Candidatus Kerfeldbacteria bacterium CG_4_10_14_0_8_um_filter_42_10 TaxID=2014248 RepID=A0A2M7RK32_9BACT|nr:MAG: hypothetical protein COY66_02500 [Candidatus Kerfeldbacteria bacterium CG_4_10_14_0_8_um_filter_42_10]
MFSIETHKESALKKSVFGHFFHRNGISCAYNALKILPVYYNSALHPYLLKAMESSINNALTAIPQNLERQFVETLTAICQAHIFVPVGYNELEYLSKVQKIAFGLPQIRLLVLHMTDYCDLCCRYCFIEGGITPAYCRRNMAASVMKRSVDKFGQIIKGRSFPKPPAIVYYGGEPLANWKILKCCLEYVKYRQSIRALPQRIDQILITNGTLVTTEIARELKKHGVMVSVSLDGPKSIHDRNRVYRNGRGSFNRTMKGFNALKQCGIRPTVSCVLGKESTERASEIIHWLLDELGVRALGFNHVSIIPDVNEYDPEYEARFGDAVIKAQEIIQAGYPHVYERRMNHKINCFLERTIIRADCTGCGEQMSVSPDGKIGICQGYMGSRKTFNGDVEDASYLPAEDPVFVEWAQRSPLNMPQCFECAALATCGGGCPRNADLTNGSIWKVDSAFCHFARKAQEWMIWLKYEKR